jgi:MFS family permease
VIDPGLDRARRAEVVDGEPEQDRVRALDLIDELLGQRPRGGLSGRVLCGRDTPGEDGIGIEMRQWIGAEIAVGDGPARVRGEPDAGGARGQPAADGPVALDAHLQQTLGFSPLKTGLAFLPMMAMIMPNGSIGQTRLVPRFGARRLVTLGMALGATAMLLLTGVTVHASYVAHVLPGLLVMGIGLGLIMAPAMSTATLGVDRRDAGVASAMVNTGQQIGGSIGTALLSTLAASAASSYTTAHRPAADLAAQAAVHGYTTAFTWSAAIFAAGALASWLLLPSGAPAPAPDAPAEPAFAH